MVNVNIPALAFLHAPPYNQRREFYMIFTPTALHTSSLIITIWLRASPPKFAQTHYQYLTVCYIIYWKIYFGSSAIYIEFKTTYKTYDISQLKIGDTVTAGSACRKHGPIALFYD